jgi:hypothetical protein
MVRTTVGVVILSALLVCLGDRVGAQGEKTSELRETMKKIGDGSSGLFTKLGRELRDEEPSWDDARRMTKEIARLVGGLTKYTPPLGDKASFDKQAKAFAEQVTALDQAVGSRDRATAFAAWKKMESQTCPACHKVHRKP